MQLYLIILSIFYLVGGVLVKTQSRKTIWAMWQIDFWEYVISTMICSRGVQLNKEKWSSFEVRGGCRSLSDTLCKFHPSSEFISFLSPEESLQSDDDDDNLSQVMRQRATIPWRSCGTYLSSAGILLLTLLLLSQLLKHTFMVSIDYWLAHWTSRVITAKSDATALNCTLVQVRERNVSYIFDEQCTKRC